MGLRHESFVVCISLISLLLVLASLPQSPFTIQKVESLTLDETLYLTGVLYYYYSHSANNQIGWWLHHNRSSLWSGDTNEYGTIYDWAGVWYNYGFNITSDEPIDYLVLIQTVDFIGSVVFDSGYVKVGTRATNSEGYQSAIWNHTAINMTYQNLNKWNGEMTYAIIVWFVVNSTSIFNNFGSPIQLYWYDSTYGYYIYYPWLSDNLAVEQITNQAWNITLYTKRYWDGVNLYPSLMFGNSTWNSRIESVQFETGVEEAEAWEPYFLFGGILVFIPAFALSFALRKKKKVEQTT